MVGAHVLDDTRDRITHCLEQIVASCRITGPFHFSQSDFVSDTKASDSVSFVSVNVQEVHEKCERPPEIHLRFLAVKAEKREGQHQVSPGVAT